MSEKDADQTTWARLKKERDTCSRCNGTGKIINQLCIEESCKTCETERNKIRDQKVSESG